MHPRRFFLIASVLLLWASSIGAQTAAGPAGRWEGKIQIPDRELSMTVDLARNGAGAWIGSLTVVGTTSADVPVDNITIDDATVRFTASLPGKTSFEGKLSADAKGLSGSVSNAEGAVPFQLARTGEARVKVPPPSSPLSKDFEGRWEGVIEAGGTKRRIVLTMTAAPDGTAVATLVSVDKGNLEIPITTVTLDGKQVQLEARVVSGAYRGSLGENGEIAGEWSEGGVRVPLVFRRAK